MNFYQFKTTPKAETLAIWQVIKGWVTCGLWLGSIAGEAEMGMGLQMPRGPSDCGPLWT